MGRRHRPHLPGATHHVASRTQFARELLVPRVRSQVEEILKNGVASGGAQLVAHAIMPTHFHALIIQGQASLGYLLQPVMCRIALLLQRYHRISGHVFERRFRSRVCTTAQHLRNSVLYIHRNPLAAELCKDIFAYQWTSHRDYTQRQYDARLSVRAGLEFVAGTTEGDDDSLRDIYVRAFRAYCGADNERDFAWTYLPRQQRSSALSLMTVAHREDRRPRMIDLRDCALRVLADIDADADVAMVRSNFKGRSITAIRQQLTAALLQRDYSVGAIAKYMRVSDSSVSRIRSEIRWGSKYPAFKPMGICETDKSQIENVVR